MSSPPIPPPPSALPIGPSSTNKSDSQLPSKPQDDTEAIQSALAKLGGLTRRTSLSSSKGGAFTPISATSSAGSGGRRAGGSGQTSRSTSAANSTVTSPNLGPTIGGKGTVMPSGGELSLSPPGMSSSKGTLSKVMEGRSPLDATGADPLNNTNPSGNTLSRMSSHSSHNSISSGPIEAPSDILERSRPNTTLSSPALASHPRDSSAWSAATNINVIGATPQGTPTSEQRSFPLTGGNNMPSTDTSITPVQKNSPLPPFHPRAQSYSHSTSKSRPSPINPSISGAPDSESHSPSPLTPQGAQILLTQPNNLAGSATTSGGTPTNGDDDNTSTLRRQADFSSSALEDDVDFGGRAGGGSGEMGYITPEEVRAMSAPNTPHFGAQTDMLKTLDESTRVIRQAQVNKRDSARAPSVSGIGNLVEKPDYSEAKIVVAMVGLPARGKSYLSNKLMRYLRWLEYKVEVFNVGQLRRSKARAQVQAGLGQVDHSAEYFSNSNPEASESREQLAVESLESLITWLKKEGNVGIHDATNSTFSRRSKIQARIAKEPGLQLIFLESLCDDPAVIATNIALKVSSGDPDYKGMSKEKAERDFRKRIEEYEKVYQTISEPTLSYCKILNVGRQVTINRVSSYMQSRIAFYLMNLHLKPRSVYLSRHGESMHNVGGMIGGDSPLSPRGEKYAAALPALILDNIGEAPLTVWTSTLQRTVSTARFLPYPKKTWKSLDELDAGVCDGMTYEEIAERYPEDAESRDEDKFNYRYRGGESYRDVVVRLEPVIMELERQENILIICHQAVIRCLYAYFMALKQEELPYIKVPLHTLIKLTPVAYGCLEERYPLPIAAVDTHRPKQVRKSAISSPTDGVDTATSPAAVNRDYFGSGLIQKLANETIKEESHEETVVEAGNDSAKDVADLKAQEGAARQSGVEAAKGEIS